MSGHAICAPSSSKMWIACPPSARLGAKFPDTSSAAAEEGTLAHALVELLQRNWLGLYRPEAFEREMQALKLTRNKAGQLMYNQAMQQHCEDYVSTVLGSMSRKSVLLVERKVKFDTWVPGGSGTADSTVITDDLLDFYDLKYGKGVVVVAEENTQLMCYALGIIQDYGWLFKIKRIRLNIIQPRVPNGHTSWEITIEELLHWAETVLRPAAELAFAGEGELSAGDHCLFCKAKPRCREYARHCEELLQDDFGDPRLLKDRELRAIYDRLHLITGWAKSVQAYMLSEAVGGKEWKGLKLVESKSNRVYKNVRRTETLLLMEGYENIYHPQELLGIGALEDNIGRKPFAEIVAPTLHKPKGAPTLAPLSDTRPPFNSPSRDFAKIDLNEL